MVTILAMLYVSTLETLLNPVLIYDLINIQWHAKVWAPLVKISVIVNS